MDRATHLPSLPSLNSPDSSSTNILSYLPVQIEVQLQPWFPRETLLAGLELLQAGKMTRFHALGNWTGCCTENSATVTLQFEKSNKLFQGFVIPKNYCGICGPKAQRQRCAHMAAAAILSMVQLKDDTSFRPLPLLYENSAYQKVASFLYDWMKRGKLSLQQTAADYGEQWVLEGNSGSLELNLPEAWLNISKALIPSTCSKAALPSEDTDADVASTLIRELELLAKSMAEKNLEKRGGNSVGWKREISWANWLGKTLLKHFCGATPRLEPSGGTFRLSIGEQGPGCFGFTVPKDKVWELVRTVPVCGEGVEVLEAGRECFRVIFRADNEVEVRPCLRLPDDTILDRANLGDCRFSSAWYLEGRGFLPTSRVTAEALIRNPDDSRKAAGRNTAGSGMQAGSLFGFMKAEQNKDLPFLVPPGRLDSFLADNQHSLRHPDNLVDRELLELQISDLPDRLIIEGFRHKEDECWLSGRFTLGSPEIQSSFSFETVHAALSGKRDCLPGRIWLKLSGGPLGWLFELFATRYADGWLRLNNIELFRLTGLITSTKVEMADQAAQAEQAEHTDSAAPANSAHSAASTEKAAQQKSERTHIKELLQTADWGDTSMLRDIPPHLRPYQGNGLAWLTRLYRFGIGGLLADDMGLGKTHQGLALIQQAFRDKSDGKVLIICPASVVLHWAEKIDRFYPGLDYTVYYGANRTLRKAIRHKILISTYGVVRQDSDQLCDHRFDLVLLDEIQQTKNPTTGIHQAVLGLNSRVKVGLTGTPVENSLQDLRALFDVCLPGLLGTVQQFDQQFIQPITVSQNEEARERLSRLIHPFILRRSRSQVLSELPDVIEDNRYCELSAEQQYLYEETVESRQPMLAELSGGGSIPFMHVLATLTRLKQICCHPALLDKVEPFKANIYKSGKWDLFVELSNELIEAGLKFVVFSQYLGMLDIIEHHFSQKQIGVARLRGDMSAGKRQQMIEQFNNDPDCRVFCASLLAGGVGIDLTGAQAVVHYDRWWNPAKEEQATARVHRMGQKHVVQVFRLITRNSLEERIHQLLQQKRDLADALLQEDEAGVIKQLDREQLLELLGTRE